MALPKYDVVIVGAGPAGITAAIALAKAQIPVLVLEGAVFPGAENWSGAVYFAENLAHPDVLGPEAVASSAFERPVTKRGLHIYNGHSMVGLTYRNPDTFRNCYTVLRPTFDHYLAELAKSFGATILTDTTADGLLRDEQGRITGVHTNRGAIQADVVFLAEGDASHLVAKEGYERCHEADSPHFLQGICEIIELPPEEIESHFQLPRGEGAAYEIVLRNGSIHNRQVNLNMGGFLYTNASSVSVGLVLPLDNLAREFGGDHNRLMEWFKALPEVRRWAGRGRSIAYGAKIIRSGGFREVPQLVDNGLVLGGACTGIGLDFPYPNFTGPATAMGRLFAQAVKQIRTGDRTYSKARLEELYEKPLRQTHYFRNTEFLEKWPHYVEHTRVFFGRSVDIAAGSLYIASHPELKTGQRLWQLAKYVRETLPPKHWKEFLTDMRLQQDALGLRRPNPGAAEKTSSVAALGECSLNFYVDGQPQSKFLWPLSRIFRKGPGMLAAAADALYRNDDTPLPMKLHRAIALAKRSTDLGTLLSLGWLGLVVGALMPIQWISELIHLAITRPSPEKYLSSFFQKYRTLTRTRNMLDIESVKIEQPWEEKLSLIRYFSDATTHIKVLRPEHFQDRTKIAASPLWHVCPARVYECRTDDLGQSQLIVNFENCIKCESCLRGAPADVDWVRDGRQKLVFGSPTPANHKLLELIQRDGHTPRPATPSTDSPLTLPAAGTAILRQFCEAVAEGPRYLDAGRERWLMHLLEQAPLNPAVTRALAHARHKKFYWAKAEIEQLLSGPVSPVHPAPHPTGLSETLNKLFPKQAIKDLEHGHRLSDEQLAFLRSLKPDSATLAELSQKDVSLALLISGLYPAQIQAQPKLAEKPWIGLTAARTHWQDFTPKVETFPELPRVAECLRAIVLGAGEMLLERCRNHALSRVQFPGLFKDEDGHDGIGKFGSVKRLLGEMEAQCGLLRALEGFDDAHAALVKILATEAFGCLPGSITYNAGQIIGGSAFSEDDIFSKFYRDSAAFHALLYDNEKLRAQLGPDAEPQLRDYVRRTAARIPLSTELDSETIKLLLEKLASSPARVAPLGAKILAQGYDDGALQKPPAFSYREALQTDQHYDYGDFLLKPHNTTEWRYVPEMLFADPELRAYHADLFQFFTENYWNKDFDGLRYYRLVEKLHMIPLEDVRAMVQRGFMRVYIPKDCGGEGLLKAHYYILCPLSMRYADPSYALTIMAHSSIGTTPILLGLNQDLPRAKADLQEFLADSSLIPGLQSEIARIVKMLDSPEALKVKKVFEALGEKVKTDIGRKPMLRAVASEFLRHFMDAGRAGLRMDLGKFKTELIASAKALDKVRPNAESVIAELDRRAEAAKLFLRLISSGQISAFALTEPNAGSDSGGIQTRAELKRVEVLTDADGVKYFQLGKDRKNIIDAATIDLSKIDYRDYDYKTDDSAKFRYYTQNGKRIPIHDIAQIRQENGKEFYEYYELNGAKMWITNGHVAGVFCLYARTPEGPTGFLVDRHAEGLIVGRDEEKMGQRGSPTNELSLNGVRVPRENVIGIEGRGQVNALETLNVGRTGLCISATAMIAKILDQTIAFAKERDLSAQPWVQEIIGHMTAELFAAESLAYELVGRFDHHGTKSVRTESAIGKYYTSEALHRAIAAAEKVFGIEGATQWHELEKHRRDARVLDIYEGTNEVQRFLILRDLVDAVLPKAANSARQDEETRHLLADLKSAVDTFGSQVWQNTGFQPTMFKLAEMAGAIKTIDSVQWRLDWLQQNLGEADAARRTMAGEAGTRYIEIARQEIRQLHEEFNRDLELLKQGLYPPATRVGMLALQAAEHKPKPVKISGKPASANVRHIVVVLNVAPMLSPRPRVIDGQLLETHFDFDPASRAALEQALAIRQAQVAVVCAAPRNATDLLQRALALGATKALLVATNSWMVDPQEAARLLAQRIGQRLMPCDLLLCPDPVVGTLVAGALGIENVAQLPAGPARDFTIQDYLDSRRKPFEIVEADASIADEFILPQLESTKDEAKATPESAAALLRKLAGIDSVGTGSGNFEGIIGQAETIPARNAMVFLATPEQLSGITAAGVWADAHRLPLHVVLFGKLDDAALRPLASKISADFIHAVDAPPQALLAVMRSLWKETPPTVLAAGSWADEVLAKFSVPFPRVQSAYDVVAIADGALLTPVYGGKIQRRVKARALDQHPLIVTFSAQADAGTARPRDQKQVDRVKIDYNSSGIVEAASAAAAASLSDAEFIIDVGYAIRNRENFDLIVLPLQKRLEQLGIKNVMIGGTRKVVEELKLLTPAQQIGQTGTTVNPRIILSLGISGAPQHVDYIGDRTTIIAFNKDASAPLMTLNSRRARPKVVPVIGDLYETVPKFLSALGA